MTIELGTGERSGRDAPPVPTPSTSSRSAGVLDFRFRGAEPSALPEQEKVAAGLTSESCGRVIADPAPTTPSAPSSARQLGSPRLLRPPIDAGHPSPSAARLGRSRAHARSRAGGRGAIPDLRISRCLSSALARTRHFARAPREPRSKPDSAGEREHSLCRRTTRGEFWSVFRGLRACYDLPLTERLVWLGCAGESWARSARPSSGGNNVALGGFGWRHEGLTGPEFAATEWLRAFARFRAVTPLVRHQFLLSEGSQCTSCPGSACNFRWVLRRT